MKFGSVPVGDALDAVLAHAVALPNGRLKKGHRLTSQDIAALKEAEIVDIVVARLEEGDVDENLAATRIADALLVGGVSAAEAFTGRVNIHATQPGVFHADRAVVDSLNRISPAITVASLADGLFVAAGRMVATVKIIPLAVAQVFVEQAVNSASGALSLSPSKPANVGLIATQLPFLKTSVMDKTRSILEARLHQAGSVLTGEVRIDHSSDALAAALADMISACDMIIVFGASAITDIDDVIPAGLRGAGGSVERFGMPVDPGNLLLVGALDGKPVIGAPGCARSPAENGFDWILQRLLAGLPVDETYITGLGVGGLLMEITARPQPREG